MKDLLLYRALGRREPLSDDLVPLLEALPTRPASVRWPFARRLIHAARDERPRVRAAAIAALFHLDGHEAIRAVVRTLSDPVPAVAAVAVEALRSLCSTDPLRIVHAVFHPDPAIRRAAVTGGLPAAAQPLLACLLADPDCVDAVAPLLLDLGRLPANSLPAILDMRAAGRLSAETAANLVGKIPPADLLGRITTAAIGHVLREAAAAHGSPGASPDEALLDVMSLLRLGPTRPAPPCPPGPDRLPEVIGLLASVALADHGDDLAPVTAFDRLVRSASEADVAVRRGVAVAAITRLLATTADDVAIVRLLVAVWPLAALCRWIDVRARRIAVEDLLAVPPERVAKEPYGGRGDDWLADVARSDILRDSPGEPTDMRTLAALARLCGPDGLKRVTNMFPVDELVDGLQQPRAAPFLALPDSGNRLLCLVEWTRGDDRSLWPRRLAHLVPAFTRELLPLLADFTPGETVELLSRLQRLDPLPEIRDPRGRRMRALAGQLGRALVGGPPKAVRDGVKTLASGPKPGHFVLETGRHLTDRPTVPASGAATLLGTAIGDFVHQWRKGPRGPADVFLRGVFLAAVDAMPEEIAARRLEELDLESLRFLLFNQFADDVIPSRLEAALRAILNDHEGHTGPTRVSVLASTIAAAGDIIGSLNRVWDALLGRAAAGGKPNAVPEVAAGADPAAAPAPTAAAAGTPSSAEPASTAAIHPLGTVDRCRLTDALEWNLSVAVAAWSDRPTRGVAEALTSRPGPQPRCVEAAAAILCCHDPLPIIDRALAAYLPKDPGMLARLDARLATLRPGGVRLPLHLHAWMWRWERHLAEALAILGRTGGTLASVVTATHSMTCGPLAVRHLDFVRCVLERCGRRDKNSFGGHATGELAHAAVLALGGEAGAAAAAMLASWSTLDPRSPVLAACRPHVFAMLPDLAADTRAALEPWVSSRGLETEPPRRGSATLRGEFTAALSAAARGVAGQLDHAIGCVIAETGSSWFMPEDWHRLVAAGSAAGSDARELARRLVLARQPHAYSLAVETLATVPSPAPEDLAALEAFLEQGDTRLVEPRLRASRLLLDHGNHVGLPLLLAAETAETPQTPRLFAALGADTVTDAVESALATQAVRESVLCDLLLHWGLTAEARNAGLHVLLAAGTSGSVRDRIIPALARSPTAAGRLDSVANCFAWGIRRGLELTGKLFTVEMIAGDDLGYTRLEEPRVFVNPLPLLRGERHGEAIVRGLVIHEVGHHVYHADADHREAMAQASKEGIFGLLNLVLDEHLERNLRALDPGMGDPLKLLAAYGFQHSPRECTVKDLLEVLGDRALEVLTGVRLQVARRRDRVVVQAGHVLRQLESRGNSFSRFMRTLRMGLGDRDADDRTREALKLFAGPFRRSDADRLLEIARTLARIFGEEVRLLEIVGGLGSPADGVPGDPIRVGGGITNLDVQQGVQRILSPPGSAGRAAGGCPVINVSADADFPRISSVVRVPLDPSKSAAYRRRVVRPAALLRRFFERLGVAHEIQRQRLQGRFLDRGRLLALAVRGEPRVLVSRRLVPSTDLFIGVAVDCSGSMADGDNIEKARLFAELLAESVRGCRGIDLQVCGFTDATIYDAGSATRCAAHALEAGGGNNDAAGLLHLATQALASRRRARLLIMISDGLPTECSVTALRKLVQQLSRRHGMCCAQVAVRPLEQECFPIHVRLEDEDVGRAVVAFGNLVVRLVQRVLARGG